MSEQLTITGGLRYTEDERDFSAPQPPPVVTVNPTSAEDENVTWDLSALYRVSNDLNVHGRLARGYHGQWSH